jgi:hypothetical protein
VDGDCAWCVGEVVSIHMSLCAGVFRSVPKAAARKVTIFIRNIQQTADADDQSRTYIENGVNVSRRVCAHTRVCRR